MLPTLINSPVDQTSEMLERLNMTDHTTPVVFGKSKEWLRACVYQASQKSLPRIKLKVQL